MNAESQRPALVRSRVAFAFRGLAGVRVFESVLLALACFALALALCLNSGGNLRDSAAWQVACVCAILVGLTWALEHRRSPAQVARAIDARLEEQGALFTAWEAEAAGEPSALAELLGRQVAARRSARSMLHAILPPTAPLLALPFVAAMLLFQALEAARFVPRAADLTALSARVGDELSGLAGADAGAVPRGAEDLSQAELAQLAELARAAARIQDELQREEIDPRAHLSDLQQRLGELEARAPADSELRRQLKRAATTLDSALMALEQPAEPGEVPLDGAELDSRASTNGSLVARGGGDGTIVGSKPPPSPADGVVPAGSGARRVGVLSGPAWPEAYDEIVARWVEARRAVD